MRFVVGSRSALRSRPHALASSHRTERDETAARQAEAQTAATAGAAQSANALSPPEAWHEVGKPGEPQFLNGWSNGAGATTTAAFYKDHEGIVHLRGLLRLGPAATVAFVLPPGFRPAPTQVSELLVGCITCTGGVGILFVFGSGTGPEPPGAVNAPGDATFLDGVSFRAEG